jgi:cardiolipin synthase
LKKKWDIKQLKKINLKQPKITTLNKIKIFHDGKDAFLSMWDSIALAKKRIWVETFILAPDDVGTKTLNLLIDAAKRGCQVNISFMCSFN